MKIIGTSPDSIDLAEDRDRFGRLLERLDIPSPKTVWARRWTRSSPSPSAFGYPVMVRPSYVLGGRAMQACWTREQLIEFTRTALEVAEGNPVLIDKFLDGAIEVDVDAVADGETRRRRGDHGAYRGGRHPLGRLGLYDPGAHALGRREGKNSRLHAQVVRRSTCAG